MIASNVMRSCALLALAGCAGSAATGPGAVTLRDACGAGQYWNGRACTPAGDAPKKIAAGAQALAAFDVDAAKAALDAAAKAGPLDHASDVALWEQRGIAAAYLDDAKTAATDFDMLLALDPGHFLSYKLAPKATFVFEQVRDAKDRTPPELDVSWSRGGKVGDPVPVDVEVLSDPKHFLHRATLFVRTRGDRTWHAADLTLAARGDRRVVLPPVAADKPVSLEVYLRAYDAQNNEVLDWADATRPREIPLRYDAPKPWYEKWWVLTIGGAIAVGAASLTAYELTLSPPDKINGTASLSP